MRLYKMQITSVPEEAILRVDIDHEAKTRTIVFDSKWQPEGWREHVDDAIEFNDAFWAKRAKDDGYRFFWPKQDKVYLSRTTAVGRKNLVEFWGGKAIVLEAEVGEFIEAETAKRNRQLDRDIAKAGRLREKAEKLQQEANKLERSTGRAGWDFR